MTIGARLSAESQETTTGVFCTDALIMVLHKMRKEDSHQSHVTLIMWKKNNPETEEETEQHNTNDYLSYQSSDRNNSDDTSTKTISADNRAVDADNGAIINTGHTAEHVAKEASDNFNAIQNAKVSFNLM